jgi:hypothetical protein
MPSNEERIAALEATTANLKELVGQVSLQGEERMQRHEDSCERFRAETRAEIKTINKTVAKWSGAVMVTVGALQYLPKLWEMLAR